MAICESPRPADKSRVLSYLGHLSKYEMRQVSVCLQYSFGFIGYKSFRKYLTAPPQEDVLAAAKELLSCYERYSSFRLSDNEKKKIGSIIQSGIDFLQKKKEVPL